MRLEAKFIHIARRAATNIARIVEHLRHYLAGCSISLQFNDDERTVTVNRDQIEWSSGGLQLPAQQQ